MVGRTISCEVNELRDLICPSILHWGFQHFVVLERVKRDWTDNGVIAFDNIKKKKNAFPEVLVREISLPIVK
ncbi:cysteine peptidase family C39 domain-containing protein [Janthinobacterium sp. 61]|uniref:cysteine peptidase family C39 domain-containing protein n=1 Tax=Janthinobacterium sp. 61 TaxID=2035209 RepID=UPI000C702EED|nr:cysteine peptidase family C39 domain-containing protein [Janthinobacterium sp. 61]